MSDYRRCGHDIFRHLNVSKLRQSIGMDMGFLTDEDYLQMMWLLPALERRIIIGRYRSNPKTFRELGIINKRSLERMRQKMVIGLRRLRVVVGLLNEVFWNHRR